MTRKLYEISFCILLALVLTGCQLTQSSAGGAAGEDRLAGIFITTEYLDLFDFEGYLDDNPEDFGDGEITINGDAQQYQGRLYAVLTGKTLTNEETGETSETKEYVFPIDGISCFSAIIPVAENHGSYQTAMFDPAISDGRVHYKEDDDGIGRTLTGTLYVSPVDAACTYYFNPVYQSADGSVYVLSGSGAIIDPETYGKREGATYSHTLDAATTITENGKAKTDSTSIMLSIHVMFPPEKIVVLQMDRESAVLLRKEYEPGAMPESIAAEPETAYFVIETHKRDDTGHTAISRDIYDSGTEGIGTFFVGEDRICVEHRTKVIWPE